VPELKGSLAVNEIVVPIVDLYLDEGKLWFVAHITGPVPAVSASGYVVFDRSGGVFFRADGIPLKWKRVRAGDTLTVIAPLSITGRTAVWDGVRSA
jgi:hypothetical protein